MARTIRDPKLSTRKARLELPIRKKPYWRLIDPGTYIGYFRGKTGGKWLARAHVGKSQYREATLGVADDAQDADGLGALNFSQAQAKAREWITEQRLIQETGSASKLETVGDVIHEYLDWYKIERKDHYNAKQRAELHILPALGDVHINKLTPDRIRKWLHKLADSPARMRSGLGQKCNYRPVSDDPEDEKRARKVSANKCLTLLKAALNKAWQEGKVRNRDAWERVKPFRGVDRARTEYLTTDEIVRLVNACEPELRSLVRGALFTGCRYGELIALRCGEYDPDGQVIHIRDSKSGKPRYVTLNTEGAGFFGAATAGRSSDTPIFLQPKGEPWKKSDQQRPFKAAVKRAKITKPATFHTLRHTYASHLIMAGAELIVVAHQLGHRDTRMVEIHYGHLAPSYVRETVRSKMPAFGILGEEDVVPMRRRDVR